jgi:hypothetical protein
MPDAHPTAFNETESGGDATTRLRSSWIARHRSGLVLLAVVAIGWLAIGLYVQQYRTFSPIDEMQHADYARRILTGGIVVSGDTILQETMNDIACLGIDAPYVGPVCGDTPYNPMEFPEQGVNTAAIHPPTYYAVMAWVGAAIRGVTPVDGFMSSTRLAGGVFLGLGALALWSLMAEFRVRIPMRAAITLIVVLAPIVFFMSATINPDATAVPAGAFVLLAVIRAERRVWPVWLPGLAAAFVISLKPTNVIAVAAAGVYLAVRWLDARQRVTGMDDPAGVSDGHGDDDHEQREQPASVQRLWWMMGWLVLGFVSASGVFSVIQRSVAKVPLAELPMMVNFRASGFPWASMAQSINVVPLGSGGSPSQLNSPVIATVMLVVSLALPALSVAALAMSSRGARVRSVAAGGLAAVLVAGPLFVVANFMLTGSFVLIPPRYALAAVPSLALSAAWALDRIKVGPAGAVTVASVSTAAVFAYLLTP